MKKLISFLMCVTMLLTMLAPVQTAWAQTVPPPGKKYFEKLVPISKDDCSGSLTQAEDLILFTDKIESFNAEDGILSIISNFTAEEWSTLCTQYYNTYKDTGKYTGEITAKVTLNVPEGAKKVAFTYIDDAFGASDDDLDAKLEYFNAPSDSGKWFDLLPEFPTISYHDISVGTISDFALTFNRAPKALLVCWLDENGNKIELAEGQYIGFTLVNFIHEFEQNDNLLFNPNHPLYVPYSRGWDIIEESWSNDYSNSQLDSIFNDQEKFKWTYDDDEG
ncbi:MAG: hypothetical protein E7334_08535 [Clostridiales bacterium]|nr:hypothetical protein [Clostridiales bacterium]